MALDKVTLESTLKSIFDGVSPDAAGETDPAKLRKRMAKEMTDAIATFVKSGEVTVASGIAVSTTGTATAQTGATTSTGKGTIS
ncbi:MAG: hypothetical protein ACK5L5_04155 [Bacteroidales bacterium]